LRRRWLYKDDLARWLSSPNGPSIPLPKSKPSCVGSSAKDDEKTTCLQGYFWSHAYTDLGKDGSNASYAGTYVGIHGAQLANSYVMETPDDNTIGYCPTVNAELGILGSLTQGGGAATGGPPIVLWPFLSLTSAAGQRPFDVRARPDTEIVIATARGPAVLADDGRVTSTSDLTDASGNHVDCGGSSVSSTIASRFGGTVAWSNAVEADPRIGHHPEKLAFAVALDGTAIVDAAQTDGRTMSSIRECSTCEAPASLVATGEAPAPRSAFTTFFSRALDGVLVAGGKDTTGAALHDLHVYDVDALTWRSISPAGLTVGSIVDLSFSYRDHKLWMIDRTSVGPLFDSVRLTRFDKDGTNVDVIGTWPVLRASKARFVLSLDRDGAPLLTAATTLGYSVVRFAALPSGRIGGHLVDAGLGDLAYRPIVSTESYAFVLRMPDGSARVRRKPSLSPCDDTRETETDRRVVGACFR
ncbi:MAG TPA: kelch repeat-containing protein, partial [Polyangiaceae bacterium]